jgi:hypothetical protein
LHEHAPLRRGVLLLALVLIARAGFAATSIGERLDALLALERPAGGWTFGSEPGTRPMGFTVIVRTAERVFAPLGLASWDLVVVRSPGTPAAGQVLLDAYRRTGEARYLDAARRAGDLLAATELRHGGWFSELPVYGTTLAWWFREPASLRPMLDDDVTPGATRFLLALWMATGEPRYRDAADRGLTLLLDAQLPGGAWPLVARPAWLRRLHASYEDQPTLNDGATPFAITTLLDASALLGDPRFAQAARRGGDWLVSAQAPLPQPGWAQQYGSDGRPAPARIFEQPALATWETRYAIEALTALAVRTGEPRYCASALAAARWLQATSIGPGCWPRYRDPSGAPLYVDAAGHRVVSVVDARGDYAWLGDFGIPWVLVGFGMPEPSARYRIPGDWGLCGEDPRPPSPLAGARALTAAIASADAGAASTACAPSTVR